MKNYIFRFSNILVLVVLSAFAVIFSSCKGDDDEDSEMIQAMLLGNWRVDHVMVNGVDKTADFSDLVLVFEPGIVKSINGGKIWAASETWAFTDHYAAAFARGDGVSVSINSITSTDLVLSLDWSKTTWEAGRASSVSGEHVFSFTR